MRRSASPLLLFLIAVLFGPTLAHAGSICGTVRNALTQSPISGVELVLFENDVITAYQTISDAGGGFCFLDVPAGVYDLRARVDDYRTGWTTAIEVTDDPTSVDVFWGHDLSFDAPWPNPTFSDVSFRILRDTNAPFTIRVHDPRGRLVRGWNGMLVGGLPRIVTWDFRDVDGGSLPSGVYFVSVTSGDQVSRRRVVHLR